LHRHKKITINTAKKILQFSKWVGVEFHFSVIILIHTSSAVFSVDARQLIELVWEISVSEFSLFPRVRAITIEKILKNR
jgi:hypothetical protein